MKKFLSVFLALALLLPLVAVAEDNALEMSDIPGMTAPGVLPIVTEPVTLVVGIPPHNSVTDYETNYFTKLIEEKTGINLEFFYLPTTSNEENQKFDLMVAANEELPDIMFNGVSDMLYYGQTGTLLTLNDYFDKYAYYYNETLDKYATDAERSALMIQSFSYDGKRYCFNYAYPDLGNNNENGMFINKKWLDAVGKEIPTTLDELYDVLIAFRDQDPNGNGLKDEIPMMGWNTTGRRGDIVGDIINSFVYYPGGVGADDARCIVNDGVVTSSFITEEYREALRFCKKLYDEGLLTELSFTQDKEQFKAIIDRPSTEPTVVGLMATCFRSSAVGFSGCSDEYNKVMEYVALPPLTGPEGVNWGMEQDSGYTDYRAYITKSCKHPEIAFRLLDLLCDVEIGLTYRYGIRGEHWDYAEEGLMNDYGTQALIKLLTDTPVWQWENQNYIWRREGMRLGLSYESLAAIPNNNPYVQYRSDVFNQSVAMRLNHKPKEVFMNPVWNVEELEIAQEYGSLLHETSDEWRTMFIVGEKDLDKDWQEYLSQLDALGLQEYLGAAQSCYLRMTSN